MSRPLNAPARTNPALLLIVAALIGSSVLGSFAINRSGFWFDEMASVGFITDSATWQHDFPEQMPAYYVLLRGWTDAVGSSELAGRWLSLLLGLLTLAVSYRIARLWAGRSVAWGTLLLLGSSAFFVRYFREMRPYMLLALCGALSVWCLCDWLTHRRRSSALLFVVVSVIGLYTHYFAGLMVAMAGLYVVGWSVANGALRLRPTLRLHIDRFTLITVALFVLIALALIPYLPSYLRGLSVGAGGYSTIALTPTQALDSTAFTLSNDSLAAALILIGLALTSRIRGRGLALWWAFFPIVTVLLVHTLVVPMYTNPRYVIFIWPGFALLFAIGLATLKRRAATITLLVLIGIGIGQVYNDLPSKVPGTLNNPPWREMFGTIGPRAQSGSVVVVNMINPVGFHNYRLPMLYYFGRLMPSDSATPLELNLPPAPDHNAIQARIAGGSELWWIATDGLIDQYGQDARYALYQAGYAQCDLTPYPGYDSSLSFWGRVHTPVDDSFAFANGLHVDRQPLNKWQTTYRPGQPLTVALGLFTTTPLTLNYSLSVQLADSSGTLIAQNDGPPAGSQTAGWKVGDPYCDEHTLSLPTAPGRYQVRFIIYDAIAGTRVPLSDGHTTIIDLLPITVG